MIQAKLNNTYQVFREILMLVGPEEAKLQHIDWQLSHGVMFIYGDGGKDIIVFRYLPTIISYLLTIFR